MGEKGKVKPPDLPKGAPPELKDFLACKRLTVELDLATLDWLPAPPGVPKELAPSVTVEPGTTPNTATASVGWGFISLSLPVSLSSDGQLNVDTTQLPNIEKLKDNIDNWVKKFNDSLKANGKRLSGFTINGTKLTFTKAAIAATGTAATPQTPAQPPPPTTPTTPTTPGTTTPSDGSSAPGKGCLIGVLAMVLVGALGAGIYFVTTDDDNKATAPAASDAPAVASTSSTSASTTSTSSTTSSTAAVAVAEDCRNLDFMVNWSTVGANPGCTWMGPIEPCDPSRLPCGVGATSPFFVVDQRTVIDHGGGPVDPLTGLQGPSAAGHAVFIGAGPDEGVMRISSLCDGQLITGQIPYVPGTVGLVMHSLFHFGPCTTDSLEFQSGSDVVDLFPALADPTFTVGPNEVPPEIFDPSVFDPLATDPRWGDSTATFLSTMSESTFDCITAQIERLAYRSVGCANGQRVWRYRAEFP
ncbi:MAG TPA: hypothetical protein VH761_06150, partial [Ilumatobacteraceae bacterium]